MSNFNIHPQVYPIPTPLPSVHSRSNALLPISRLPTEILAIVFEYFEEEKRFDESADNDVPACLAVTHVCGYLAQRRPRVPRSLEIHPFFVSLLGRHHA
ncbi:hypothetical protein DEU56DRAFT_911226 [Suillus clintonianus]|uniref:uncharacterized protein n=1 Tax=Suillus clintonianus TaxID=1904413 RepID=UPI001B86C309|nr:uncharacterized protein DEU56DRAFT_911226 [Suillus clintonianus]KAG2141885.1 hypothetical protein DEU56DRAFT_911226 [Suillus clintonianus]